MHAGMTGYEQLQFRFYKRGLARFIFTLEGTQNSDD